MYDILIKNGLVVDGTGEAPFKADVALKQGRIAKIAPFVEGEAERVIDAQGKAVAPGFLDIHSHSDAAMYFTFDPESKIAQGVTFELTGNCGISLLPATPETRAAISQYFFANLQFPVDEKRLGTLYDMNDYVEAGERLKPQTNYGILVGHGTLRGASSMGFANRDPEPEEQKALEDKLEELMKQGAFGMSLGLIYPPSAFAGAKEIEGLAKVVAKYDGILAVHIRNEGPKVFESVQEMLDIAEHSGVHLEISHLKIMTKSLWGQSDKLLKMIDDARSRGVNVTCDQYPFFASSTSLTALCPHWAHDGGISALLERVKTPSDKLKEGIAAEMESRGGADRIVIASTHAFHPEWESKTLEQIAKELGTDNVTAACRILAECECAVNANYFSQAEEDRDRILSRTDICVGSDGYNTSLDRNITTGLPHPRSFSTFVHALELCRSEKLMPLEAIVRKMTGKPADNLGMTERGYLREGKIADVTIFDPETVAMAGDFMNPVTRPVGIETVIVGGAVAYENGRLAAARNGRVLRRGKC